MSEYNQWEVWEVHWKYHDGRILPRPALLISPSRYNDKHPDFVFSKITTRYRNITHIVELDRNNREFAGTGLTRHCYVYPVDIQKIPIARLIHKRGVLGINTTQLVLQELNAALGGGIAGAGNWPKA